MLIVPSEPACCRCRHSAPLRDGSCTHPPPPPAHHVYELERNTVLRWEQWVPVFSNITALQRSKEAYERLRYPQDVRFTI